MGSTGKLFKGITKTGTSSPRPQEKGRKEVKLRESAPLASGAARRGAALGRGPGALRGQGGAAQARRRRSRRPPASAFPPARRPGRRGERPWVMAGGAAPQGAELLAFARFRESSKQPLAYGYGPRSLRELRQREFGRLAGEAGGGTCAGWAWGTWRAPVFWN